MGVNAALFVLLALGLAEPPATLPASEDPDAPCATCHADVAAARRVQADVHAGLGCTACHAGISPDPHASQERTPELEAEAARFRSFAKRSPEAYAACGGCHSEVVADWLSSVHGNPAFSSTGRAQPSCADCHGSVHTIVKPSQDKREMAARCIRCHTFQRRDGEPLGRYVVDSYRDTIHGKALALGNLEAAACGDCHTGHRAYLATDPRSTVNPTNRTEMCRKCHPDATPRFAAAISHKPREVDEDFWGWLAALAFSTLATVTMFFLFLHIAMDLYRSGRRAMARGGAEAGHAAVGPLPADEPVRRFGTAFLVQHWGMMIAFVSLVLTGWLLRSASVGPSATLAGWLGGQRVLSIWHKAAGILMLVVAAYHLVWVSWLWRRGRLRTDIVPSWRDFRDLYHNIQYFFGLRQERPDFGRYAYYEKFDYWAKSWGVLIMAVTGFILWFPEAASRLVTGKIIALSQIAHGFEALLAGLAIFLWHFYNVHLRPAVFPMSWAWLTGRISAEHLYEEHRAEYRALYGENPPGPRRRRSEWHEAHQWAYIALFVVIAMALLMVAGNVSTVRDRLKQLQEPAAWLERGHEPPPGQTAAAGILSVRDPGFDLYGTCFACHDKQRYELGTSGGFAHKKHFDEMQLDSKCDGCHELKMHRSAALSTAACMNCHEQKDIGLAAKQAVK